MVNDPEVITAGADKIAQTLKGKLDAALDPRAEKKKVCACKQILLTVHQILVSTADIPRSYPPKDASVPLLGVYLACESQTAKCDDFGRRRFVSAELTLFQNVTAKKSRDS